MRALLAGGARGTLSELWAEAAPRLAAPDDPSAEAVLTHIAEKLQLDGDVVDCDRAMPARVLTHVWQAAQRQKSKAFRTTVERLVVRLSDILRAAYIHSEAGQRPDALRAALGGGHRDAFDFTVMSRLVARNAPKDELPPARRRRIESALAVLKAQPFFPDPRLADRPGAAPSFEFLYDNCAAAAGAYRERLPKLADVVKAISMAELEAAGAYDEAQHDAFFARFDERALSPDDIAMFPDYLVCIPADRADAPENAGMMDMLSAGLPVKVLIEATDLFEEASVGTGHYAFGVRSARLANTATALGGVFVVQTASSNLLALRERLAKAFAHRGAGLVCVYAGAGAVGELPPYLTAAAAMESRAFPAFTYDPYAGDNQAARFSLEDNPQPEADWPVAPFEYADENLQRVTEETPVHDRRLRAVRHALRRAFRAHSARAVERRDDPGRRVARARSEDRRRRDALCARGRPRRRAAAGDRRHAADADRRALPDLLAPAPGAGRHPQLACADPARAREGEVGAGEGAGARCAQGHACRRDGRALRRCRGDRPGRHAPAAAAAAPAAPERNPDEAWIETARCPSCNECQNINDKMFTYNDNKQAYIVDVKLGTYRQLVEAAEACQVAIIHPGKPWNPNEPGLEELIARAEAFG